MLKDLASTLALNNKHEFIINENYKRDRKQLLGKK